MLHFLSTAVAACHLDKVGDCQGEINIIINKIIPQIAESQFASYSLLESVEFQADSSCKIFQANAFSGLSQLHTILLPDNLEYIRSSCFKGCKQLTSIVIPSSMLEISEYAFYGCTGISSLTFPETGSIVVQQFAFDASPIATLEVKKSVIAFGGLISMSSKLVSFTCTEDHEYFTAQEGALFSKDMSTLVMYPPGKMPNQNYEVPKSVTHIASNSFNHARCNIVFPEDSLIQVFSTSSFNFWLGSTITFPAECNLKTISKSAFTRADNLKVFTIPKSVETIEGGAFASSGIAEFRVIAGSTYSVRDGVLMSNKETILVAPPNITTITIPSDITTISANAFTSASIEYVYFERGSKLKTIGTNAFSSSQLKYIDLDPNCPMTSISYGAFLRCPLVNFTFPLNVGEMSGTTFAYEGPPSFIVADEHEYLAVVDGVVFNKAMNRIMCYPPTKPDLTYIYPTSVDTENAYTFYGSRYLQRTIVPAGSKLKQFGHGSYESASLIFVDMSNAQKLDTISVNAFAHNRAYTTLRIPDSVTTIGIGAFQNNINLEKVFFSKSLKQLSSRAFSGCTALKYIEFDIFCPLNTIDTLCFSATPVQEITIPWLLQSVAADAFSGTVAILRFVSKPRHGVLSVFASYATLRELYLPCECADWTPTVQFAGETPAMIICCPTRSVIRRRIILVWMTHLMLW